MSAPALRLEVPGSKSLTQRALVAAALALGESRLVAPLDCDDSRALRAALGVLGVGIDDTAGGWRVRGGGLRAVTEPVFSGDGGTTLRFLAALALVLAPAPGAAAVELVLDASPQLRRRPHAALLEALAALGLEVRCRGGAGLWPLELVRRGPVVPRVGVAAAQSSQFASALLLVAPRCPEGLVVELEGEPVSRPYLDLTLEVMRAFGATVDTGERSFRVHPGPYRARTFAIEGDWSSAAFLLAAAEIAGVPVAVPNVRPDSAQGDRRMADFLATLAGARQEPLTFDLGPCPDLIAPLAVACAFARVPCRIEHAAHARHKESDRIAVLAGELGRAGVRIAARPDGLALEPGGALVPARLDPHGDHRMAMAFGLLSLREPGIEVADRACVRKSYPGFWDDLERVRAHAARRA
ncbi:MAG: 3-phosphoshikimate 1-carboxyvinyltransferase [Myxococcales bacterium]|nr:3-phosphoshikimate 1-carboxyvinyltransferase [Myxococcales bacterium]